MAFPTNVRVEANGPELVALRWDLGSATNAIHRSTNGTDFSILTTVYNSAITYVDTNVTAATRYWYKITDDAGLTFSSTVNVTTHTCPTFGQGINLALPGDDLEDLARRVEDAFNANVAEPKSCNACTTNGAIILDCATGCVDWVVDVNADINSITIEDNCDHGNIVFNVPDGSTYKICGWPEDIGFTGDECNDAALTGPRNMGVSYDRRNKNDLKIGAPAGAGGADCTCVPNSSNSLKIECCGGSTCSINCKAGETSISLKACGGTPPYTWSTTYGTIEVSGTRNERASVRVVKTTGIAGTAYDTHGCCGNVGVTRAFNCEDQMTGCAGEAHSPHTASNEGCMLSNASCSATGAICGDTGCIEVAFDASGDPSTSACNAAKDGIPFDLRTAQMITDGCKPCGLLSNAVVTVTDSVAASTTKTLDVTIN